MNDGRDAVPVSGGLYIRFRPILWIDVPTGEAIPVPGFRRVAVTRAALYRLLPHLGAEV